MSWRRRCRRARSWTGGPNTMLQWKSWRDRWHTDFPVNLWGNVLGIHEEIKRKWKKTQVKNKLILIIHEFSVAVVSLQAAEKKEMEEQAETGTVELLLSCFRLNSIHRMSKCYMNVNRIYDHQHSTQQNKLMIWKTAKNANLTFNYETFFFFDQMEGI